MLSTEYWSSNIVHGFFKQAFDGLKREMVMVDAQKMRLPDKVIWMNEWMNEEFEGSCNYKRWSNERVLEYYSSGRSNKRMWPGENYDRSRCKW